MTADDHILRLIRKLKDIEYYNIDVFEGIFGNKFSTSIAPENDLDWLVPNTETSSEVFELFTSASCPQIKHVMIDIRAVSGGATETFLSIYLKPGAYINTDSIANSTGQPGQLNIRSGDAPLDKQCYMEFVYPDRTLTLGFQSCDQLDKVSHFSFRFNH